MAPGARRRRADRACAADPAAPPPDALLLPPTAAPALVARGPTPPGAGRCATPRQRAEGATSPLPRPVLQRLARRPDRGAAARLRRATNLRMCGAPAWCAPPAATAANTRRRRRRPTAARE